MPKASDAVSDSDARQTAEIQADRYDAILVDLDGVVTRTASVHAAAWKSAFDSFLRERSARLSTAFVPFDAKSDYSDYVDGKPRADGVRGFLESRGIILPPGDSRDSPDTETVCGLANRKNALFLERIRNNGVQVYRSTIEFLADLKDRGFKSAVVSSSRNCAAILEAAGQAHSFDTRVDGCDLDDGWLSGKPAPDMFLEAARRLGVDPSRCIVVEDALAGVDAGSDGGFGLVVGVARNDNGREMRAHGADIVVSDLAELSIIGDRAGPPSDSAGEISPADLATVIVEQCGDRKLALFLDYDGTLTPIVARPEDAVLSDTMHRLLERLSRRHVVGVISGRARADIEERVGIPGLYYAGSHGFDISCPGNRQFHHAEGREFVPAVQRAEEDLRSALHGIPGALVEGKTYSVAVHYRLVDRDKQHLVRSAVDAVAARYPNLRRTTGKMVFELLPNIDWDKGRAVTWLLHAMGLEPPDAMPVYIGDDVTDEDAFATVSADGIGVLVADAPRATQARYRLAGPDAVMRLFEHLSGVSG
ncbi:MAG: trehalose-phosphatase [Alphaproteobacteria bacterium]|nr:trehalose-phosphatase [Alphaproteobacteria bacterium]